MSNAQDFDRAHGRTTATGSVVYRREEVYDGAAVWVDYSRFENGNEFYGVHWISDDNAAVLKLYGLEPFSRDDFKAGPPEHVISVLVEQVKHTGELYGDWWDDTAEDVFAAARTRKWFDSRVFEALCDIAQMMRHLGLSVSHIDIDAYDGDGKRADARLLDETGRKNWPISNNYMKV